MSPIVAAVWLLHDLKGVKTSQGGRRRRRRRRRKKGWRKTDEKLRKIPEGRSVHGTPTPAPDVLAHPPKWCNDRSSWTQDKILNLFPKTILAT